MLPEYDELVIVKIKKVYPYGAFCELEEYPSIEAFIHVSEVASGWIKNIHEFLKEGQNAVGRVYRVVPEKNLIDISLKRVTEEDARRKLEAHKRQKRAIKLLEIVESKIKSKTPCSEVIAALEEKYGELYAALEDASLDEENFRKIQIAKEWEEGIIEIAKENIKKQKRIVSGILKIQSFQPNGVVLIKNALLSTKANFTYLGSPRYLISVEEEDYKKCERKLKEAIEKITTEVKRFGGYCTFERKE